MILMTHPKHNSLIEFCGNGYYTLTLSKEKNNVKCIRYTKVTIYHNKKQPKVYFNNKQLTEVQ